MKKFILPFVGAVGSVVLLSGCLSTGPTPQDQLEANTQKNISTYTKPALDKAFEKAIKEDVLNEEELEKLNVCIAQEMTKRLSQEEKLFLGGNVQEKASAKGATETLKEKVKPTSQEMKESLGTCSVALGLERVTRAINEGLNK